LRAADGAYRWFLSRAVPVRDASGEIVKWFGTATDIDDAERAAASQRFLAGLGRTLAGSLNPEETLRRVARLLVPMLGDDCYVDLLEPSGEIRRVAWAHVDPAAERQFAESPARFVPRVLHREHPIARAIDSGEAQILSDMDDAWLERIAFSPEHLAFMRRRRYRSQLTLPLRARGRTLGVLTVCHAADSSRQYTPDQVDLARDVAERIALAVDNALLYSEARQAEAKVRRVLDAGVVGVILTADDRVVEANDHFLAMIGATRAELDRGDLRWPAMTPATYAALDTAALAELEERGSVTPYEKQFIRRDGTLVPVLVGSAELQREPRQNIGFVLDLTEQKRAEDEWRAFIDSTAHDLRNPLTAVLGQTQLLQRRLRRQGTIDPSDADARLAAIASGSRRAARLIDDLIDTARLRAGQPLEFHPSPVDLAALATACVEEVRRVARTHHVKVEAESPRLIVAADGPRIERVIRNMLDNAIKYSPDGGEVVVRARREEDGRGRWAILEVEDHGLGIPAADLPHVFDRFRRGGNVAGRIEGSGIGLTGARPLIEQHGGTIDVASAEGAGSTFRLRLPLLTDRA
jgi:PAS domain S-box-containing protein